MSKPTHTCIHLSLRKCPFLPWVTASPGLSIPPSGKKEILLQNILHLTPSVIHHFLSPVPVTYQDFTFLVLKHLLSCFPSCLSPFLFWYLGWLLLHLPHLEELKICLRLIFSISNLCPRVISSVPRDASSPVLMTPTFPLESTSLP